MNPALPCTNSCYCIWAIPESLGRQHLLQETFPNLGIPKHDTQVTQYLQRSALSTALLPQFCGHSGQCLSKTQRTLTCTTNVMSGTEPQGQQVHQGTDTTPGKENLRGWGPKPPLPSKNKACALERSVAAQFTWEHPTKRSQGTCIFRHKAVKSSTSDPGQEVDSSSQGCPREGTGSLGHMFPLTIKAQHRSISLVGTHARKPEERWCQLHVPSSGSATHHSHPQARGRPFWTPSPRWP